MSAYLHDNAKAQLATIIQRIERLEDEKAVLAEDIKQVYLEAKSNGFDTKAIRKLLSLKKKPEQARLEEEAILETYMRAVGMPLFEAADTPRIPAGQHSDAGRTPLEDAIERAA